MAGNHASCKHQESLGRQREAGTSRLTGNHTFWDDKCPGGRQRKVGRKISSRRWSRRTVKGGAWLEQRVRLGDSRRPGRNVGTSACVRL